MAPKTVLFASLLLSIGGANAAPFYTVTDLDAVLLGLGSSTGGYVSDINNSGQMVGTSGETGHAFLYDGTMHDLGTLGQSSSAAFGINDSGQVVGEVRSGSSFDFGRAFLYDGTMHELQGWGSGGAAYSINGSGQIAGYANVAPFDSPGVDVHAVLYDGTMHDLGTLGPNFSSAAWDINDSGQVIGDSGVRAFLYDGTMHDLGTLGGFASYAGGINNNGQVVGTSEISYVDVETLHAFMYDGTMHDLGTLDGPQSGSVGRDINMSGQVVGFSYASDSSTRAFLYDGGVMSDLNDLIDPLSGWFITDVSAINDKGDILANGYDAGGARHSLLLAPATQINDVPEPAIFALLCIGLFGFAIVRRSKAA